jgi:hypothetical protein
MFQSAERRLGAFPKSFSLLVGCRRSSAECRVLAARPVWVTSGHAEHVAAATGSPQKADPLAAGRDFGLGPQTDVGASQMLQQVTNIGVIPIHYEVDL